MQYEDGKNFIRKENAYEILKAFAKEYRRRNANAPAEIIIVGGGSILLNYGFRDFTQDLDVMIHSISGFKDIVYKIADDYHLPNDWMNTDFMKTSSFSEKLRQVSTPYCSFNHGSLEIRTVRDEYLIAMKMMSARGYRNDRSDIIGILLYAWKDTRHITFGQIEKALDILYENHRSTIKSELLQAVKTYTDMDMNTLSAAYAEEKVSEDKTREEILVIDKEYPGAVTEASVDSIVASIRKKRGN